MRHRRERNKPPTSLSPAVSVHRSIAAGGEFLGQAICVWGSFSGEGATRMSTGGLVVVDVVQQASVDTRRSSHNTYPRVSLFHGRGGCHAGALFAEELRSIQLPCAGYYSMQVVNRPMPMMCLRSARRSNQPLYATKASCLVPLRAALDGRRSWSDVRVSIHKLAISSEADVLAETNNSTVMQGDEPVDLRGQQRNHFLHYSLCI